MTKQGASKNGDSRPKIVAVYDYADQKGRLLYQVVRYEPGFEGEDKTFRQRRPDGKGGWINGLKDVRRVLYRLDELAKAPADRPVYVVEGEKDVETLRGQEFLATTSPMGAGNWRDEYSEALRGRHVFVLPDNDEAGRKHAAAVAKSLAGVAASVTVVGLPGLPPKGDVTDWLALPGNNKTALLKLVQGAVEKIVAAKGTGAKAPAAGAARKAKAPPEPYRPFPLHALPQPLASFVQQGACALGCDPAYVALPVLSVVASAIGNTRTVRLKRNWHEPCVFWTGIVGDSGTLKSPARLLAVSYLARLQKRHIDDYNGKQRQYQEDKARFDREKGKAQTGRPTPVAPEEPACKRVVCSDTTIERLADILADNPRGVLVSRDELDGWLGSFSRYKGRGSGSDLPQWLEMFRAETLIVDRKTADRKILFVPRAGVSILGTIQPGVLQRALTPNHMEAGLGARLLLAMPPKVPKQWSEVEIHPDAEGAFEQLLDRLLELDFDADRQGERIPFAVRLTPEAKEAWVTFYNAWARVQANAEGDLAAIYSKLEAYAARTALLHHVVTHVTDQTDSDPIEAVSVEAGVELVYWFAAEARRIYVALAEPEDDRRVRRLVEFIRARGGSITARRLQRSNPARYKTAEDAESALDDLAQMGMAVWVDQPSTAKGGCPTRALVLNSNLTPDRTDTTSDDGEDGDDDAPTQPPDRTSPTARISAEKNGSVSSVRRQVQGEAQTGADPKPEPSHETGEVVSGAEGEGDGFTDPGCDPGANPFRDES